LAIREIQSITMRYCHTQFCNKDCACRKVADKAELVIEISDTHNHIEESRDLMEKIRERRRLKEEAERMGIS